MSEKIMIPKSEEGEQELQEIPSWLANTLAIISIIMIVIGLLTIILYSGSHYLENFNAPKPDELQATTMIAVGSLILIILYLPWSKIKFGDFELERVVQEQTQDYSLYIEELQEQLEVLSRKQLKTSDTTKKTKSNLTEKDQLNFAEKQADDTQIDKSKSSKKNIEDLLLKFLSKWSTYGFTISRIINWGGDRSGFEAFQDLNNMELRLTADKLVREGKVKTRLSSNGNILYQINN